MNFPSKNGPPGLGDGIGPGLMEATFQVREEADQEDEDVEHSIPRLSDMV